jgi:hypothetical protein
MSTIYRQTLKGIDEVAFKSGGLPLRLMSYLLVIDGEASVDQLVARHPNLPSMQAVLQGLCGQGFIEVAGMAANVVDIGQMRVSNGANVQNSAPPPQQAPAYNYAPAPQQAPSYSQPANNGNSSELDLYKSNMIRDVSALLAADAAPVISKIQGCRTRDDLFSTMMGIKKIITIYTNREAADKFVARYSALAN